VILEVRAQESQPLNFRIFDNSIKIEPMKKKICDAYGILSNSTTKKFSIEEIDSALAKNFLKGKYDRT